MKKETVTGNYLDFIPVHRESCCYRMGDSGDVTILQENRGLFHWIAQKVFHRPRISQIHLDEMGNFIWPLMDGERTVYDIAMLVREEFGEKAEPLFQRFVQYVKNLESYGFVEHIDPAGGKEYKVGRVNQR